MNSQHPGFRHYHRLRDELLGLPDLQWVERCSELAAARGLLSASGAPLRFVVEEVRRGALGYEAAILHTGRIACRPAGRGALHDLHNALTWLTFPLVKATLNRLHLSRADRETGVRSAGGRGPIRDAVTLLDENGLLWLSDSVELNRQLVAKDWQALLVSHRERVRREVTPVIIGHGLLEKLASPFKSMTAHCLICETGGLLQSPTLDEAADGAANGVADDAVNDAAHDAANDGRLARLIAAAFASELPPRLAPLPILGLPGWDPANSDRSYYDDPRVFRAGA